MNVNTSKTDGNFFSIGDVVSYSNIEITNVNDNKPPMKIVAVKAVVFCIIAALVAALLFI
ncbi:MAG: hypothetical protein LBJ96_02730 [Holosporaceae bacterium]|jgi:hypothetical protein|nr:hypothetical protein [Holosporaceae bacterium]